MSQEHQPVNDDEILGRTLRLTGLLVGACILFVGALSVTAVFVTSRAVGPASNTTTQTHADTDDAKPAPPNAKKPLSI